MKVLFYLPMVTPWWFDHVIEPLIRALAKQCEIYVLAPAPWCGTGIGTRELQRCVDLPDIHWCIMEGPDHPSTRTLPEAKADIVAWVQGLAPDYVLCRSADYDTIQSFPGTVKLLMEGRLEPFAPPPYWIVFEDRPLDQGMLPQLSATQRDSLMKLIEPAWTRLHESYAARACQRESVFARCGVTSDRPVLLVPLEAETEDNFFSMHSIRTRPNHQLVATLAERVGADFTLIVTNHPINDLHVDTAPLLAAVAELDNVVLAPPVLGGLPATLALAGHVDGMILGDSKTYALGAFFGKPMLRQTQFESGAWLKSYSDLDSFLSAVTAREAECALPEEAQLWFAFYMANKAFDPNAADLEPAQILAHMERPVDSGRWEAGIARLRLAVPALFA